MDTLFTPRNAEAKDVEPMVRLQRLAVEKAWRPVIKDDFDKFLREKFDPTAQIQKYHERLADPKRLFIVAEHKGCVVGFIGARMHEPNEQPLGYEYQATALYLEPAYEGSGASLVLLSELFDALTQRGAKNLCGWCLAANRLARNFYAKRGGTLIMDAVTPPEYAIAPHVAYGWNL